MLFYFPSVEKNSTTWNNPEKTSLKFKVMRSGASFAPLDPILIFSFFMQALLIPHLMNGWPYLVIAAVCVVGVFHFRERLDK